jgi:hypothetical protein
MILLEDAKGEVIAPQMGMQLLVGANRLFQGDIDTEWRAHPAQVASIQNLAYAVCIPSFDKLSVDVKKEYFTSVSFCGRSIRVETTIDKGTLILYDPKRDRELGRIINLKEPQL